MIIRGVGVATWVSRGRPPHIRLAAAAYAEMLREFHRRVAHAHEHIYAALTTLEHGAFCENLLDSY